MRETDFIFHASLVKKHFFIFVEIQRSNCAFHAIDTPGVILGTIIDGVAVKMLAKFL